MRSLRGSEPATDDGNRASICRLREHFAIGDGLRRNNLISTYQTQGTDP